MPQLKPAVSAASTQAVSASATLGVNGTGQLARRRFPPGVASAAGPYFSPATYR